ncbi:DUF305 domain-containing protein [Allosalinactinospora lopnorensis]|uniref:DUF305 domain-containing protein n=1 Tax=Allosalinactinospora lopnorensis TaxID=1352348 RepID=UPI000623BC99|nr:DUF305 domain-containing protein [Allosalinactinospora lopnorensis]
MTTRTCALLLPGCLTVLLASCGTTGQETGAPANEAVGKEFNDADVAFVQSMIPHHEQAVEMSELAESRAGDEVGELAERIKDGQGPEIERLTGMLDEWGEEPLSDGHVGRDMVGMLGEEQMVELEDAEGEAFDTVFLQQMVGHHAGAVEMAREQLDEGRSPEVTELAEETIDVQEAEIEEMRALLNESEGDDGDTADEDDSRYKERSLR